MKQEINKIVDVWLRNLDKKDTVFLPFLGPFYLGKNNPRKILVDILKYATRKDFLSYDKNRRWYKIKKEKIPISYTIIEKRSIFLPVIDDYFKRKLKIFYYSSKPVAKSDFVKAKQIARRFSPNSFVFYCFKKPQNAVNFYCHNIYLKKFTTKDLLGDQQAVIKRRIFLYEQFDPVVKKTLSSLGTEDDLGGFAFLWSNFLSRQNRHYPIFCAIENQKIIGAIGPLEIMKDPWDNSFLAPPYFGVKSGFRGENYGTFLWKAAIDWA